MRCWCTHAPSSCNISLKMGSLLKISSVSSTTSSTVVPHNYFKQQRTVEDALYASKCARHCSNVFQRNDSLYSRLVDGCITVYVLLQTVMVFGNKLGPRVPESPSHHVLCVLIVWRVSDCTGIVRFKISVRTCEPFKTFPTNQSED